MILGVVGAGTMGAGIAQLGCQAGVETRLLDADPAALERARERVAAGVAKAAAKGRAAPGAAERLRLAEGVEALAGCAVVVEAIPEDLALKHRVLTEVAGAVGGDCVLATNTSSIPVTQVAAGVPGPERVAGMHFFNPAPVMRLVEVVRGVRTSEAAARAVTELGEAMGKRVIAAADGPGFLVNRCNRPFGLEALRCLEEGLADVETIDRVVRLGGGFRMGPFELQDLVGVDVGFEVSRSFHTLSFGEPRWRPSPLQARMAAAGRHGRKTGHGWYAYGDGPHRPDDPPAPEAAPPGDALLVVAGASALAGDLFVAAAEAGWEVASPEQAEGEVPWLVLDCEPVPGEARPPLQGGPQALLCAHASLAALEGDGPAVGFHALPPLADARLVELTRGPGSAPAAAERAERFFATLGMHVAWVGDAPGLVLGRIVCQLVNEAAFALGERVGSAEDIDAGMVLGLNHPRGPLEWADAIGLDHVLAVLHGLWDERREERYRAAPALARTAALDLTFRAAPPFH
jgi:3-hydroxybutyryl-CoA dehydrogenase